jgi:hypothetical protein
VLFTKEEKKVESEKKRTNVYISKPVLSGFQEICRRERSNVSQKLEKLMLNYNQAHQNGNPQLKISTYAKPSEPNPMRVLCNFINGALSDGKVSCRRAGMWVPGVRCYSCDKNQLRRKNG